MVAKIQTRQTNFFKNKKTNKQLKQKTMKNKLLTIKLLSAFLFLGGMVLFANATGQFDVNEASADATFRISGGGGQTQIGQTWQMVAVYDPDGAGPDPEYDVTDAVAWTSSNEASVYQVGMGKFTAFNPASSLITATFLGLSESDFLTFNNYGVPPNCTTGSSEIVYFMGGNNGYVVNPAFDYPFQGQGSADANVGIPGGLGSYFSVVQQPTAYNGHALTMFVDSNTPIGSYAFPIEVYVSAEWGSGTYQCNFIQLWVSGPSYSPPTDNITGELYLDNGATPDATPTTLRMSINGGTSTTTTTTAGTGAYSFSTSGMSNGDIVTIWVDGGSVFGTTVLRYGSLCGGSPSCSGISVVRNQVRLENKHTGNFTNATFAGCDNDTGTGCSASNIGFTSNGGVLTIASGRSLFLPNGVTFAPENNVTISDGGVTAAGNGQINASAGTFLVHGSGNFGGSSTWNFINLTFGNGSGSAALTATGVGAVNVSGVLTVAAYQTLNMGSKVYTLSGTGTPLVKAGTVYPDTSRVVYTGSTANVAALMFNNLTLGGSGTYTLPSSTLSMRGNLIISSGATVNKGSGTLLFASGTDEQSVTDNTASKQDLGVIQVASLSSGEPWCDVNASVCNSDWSYRKKINLLNSASSAPLYDFPILVTLNTSNIEYAKIRSNGEDLRFVDTNNVTLLSYEIEKWNPGGTSLIWVKIPYIANNNSSYFWIYYGNSSASSYEDPSAVWDEFYEGVFHMNNNSGSSTVTNSTGNADAVNGQNTSSKTTSGKVGSALNYDGISDITTTEMSTSETFTWEAWVKPRVLNGHHSIIVEANDYMLMDLYSDGSASFWTNDGQLGGGNLGLSNFNTGQWNHMAFVREGSSSEPGYSAYKNGGYGGYSAASGKLTPSSPITFGYRNGVGQAFDGVIDEVRVSSIARSPDWIRATVRTMNNEMNSFGVEESKNTNLVLNSDIKITELIIDSNQVFDENGTRTMTFTGTTLPLSNAGEFINDNSTIVFAPTDAGTTTIANGIYNNVIFNRVGNIFTMPGETTVKNLTISAGTLTAPSNANLTVKGDLTNNATLTAPLNANLTVKGDFINNGTFNRNGSTVIIDPPTDGNRNVTIGGSSDTSFHNFVVNTPNTKVNFAANRIFTFRGQLTATGQSGSPVLLYSGTPGSQWLSDFRGGVPTMSYVAVRDAGCAGSTDPQINERMFDHGNNGSCWRFISRGNTGGAVGGGGAGGGGAVGGGGAGGNNGGNTQATATANLFFDYISSVDIAEAGSGYTEVPLVCVEGDGSGAILEASIKNGALATVEIRDSGFGYSYANVIIAAPGTSGGSCGSTTGGGSGGSGGSSGGGGPGGGPGAGSP